MILESRGGENADRDPGGLTWSMYQGVMERTFDMARSLESQDKKEEESMQSDKRGESIETYTKNPRSSPDGTEGAEEKQFVRTR